MKTLLIVPLALAIHLASGAPDPDPALPGEALALQLDPVHSSAIFRIQHAGCAWFYGRINNPSGTIAWDPDDPSACSFEITLAVDDVNTGAPGRDAHLKRADFFDMAQFPEISFTSTEVVAGDAENTYQVTGDLQMRGVTRTITIPVEFTGQGRFRSVRYGFASTFTVKRSEWGVSYGLGSILADEVQLTFGLEAMPQGR